MRRIPLIADVIAETALDRPELRIHPHTDLLARLGVSTEGLSRDDPRGDDRRRRPGAGQVRHRRPADADPGPARREARAPTCRSSNSCACRCSAAAAASRLAAIADISLDQGPTSIDRYDRERRADRGRRSRRQVRARRRHEGDLRPAGDEEPAEGRQVQASRAMRKTSPICPTASPTPCSTGLMMVYAVLVLLFGSFLQPITILFSLPLSIGGAIIAADRDRQHAADGAGVDRHPDADGHRHQERHHAGRFRDRVDSRRHGARRGHHRCRPEARATDRHDDDRDGRRHDAERAGASEPAANSARRWRSR